jgi:hypothetical protein
VQAVAHALTTMRLGALPRLEVIEPRSGYSIDILLLLTPPPHTHHHPRHTSSGAHTKEKEKEKKEACAAAPGGSRAGEEVGGVVSSRGMPLWEEGGEDVDAQVHIGGGQGGEGRENENEPAGWLVEVDGPSHFLLEPSHRPRGSTLLKRRHLQALGFVLVSIPYWEWAAEARHGLGACQAYLAAKLSLFQGQAGGGGSAYGLGGSAYGGARTLHPFPLFSESLPLPTDLALRVRKSSPTKKSQPLAKAAVRVETVSR